VIGVTPNGFFSGLRRGAPPHVVFLSMQPQPPAPGETILYARHDGDLAAIAPAIGRALKDVDARIPVEQMQRLAAASDAFTWPARVITILLTIFAVGSPLHQELLKDVPYPRADILFDREHRIDLGGVHVRLLWRGPMHTRGDTLIFVEEDKVLFSGDVVMNRAFLAAGATSSINTWLTTLDELAALGPTVVVPSHGAIGDASLIARDRDYLRAVRTRVSELKAQGKSADDAAQTVVAEIQAKFPDWTAPMRIGAAARAAYAER
jgi:glyoxylase-like metal-dependent hydrolase (beta-lactamase superfamily II)